MILQKPKSSLLWTIFVILIFHFKDVSSLSCSTVRRLAENNVTANMRFAETLDNINNKVAYTNLDNDRAFCAHWQLGFYIQIDFKTMNIITQLQIQGFQLNGSNYHIKGFTLESSLDGVNWYKVHEEKQVTSPKYFIVKGTGNTAMSLKVPEQVVGKYMRLFPRSPGKGENWNVMCVQFAVFGCTNFQLPKVTSKTIVTTGLLDKGINLTCSTHSVVGIILKWVNHTTSSKHITEHLPGERVETVIHLKLELDEMFKFSCITSHDDGSVTCSYEFVCQSTFVFKPSKIEQSITKVLVKIFLPTQVKAFSVASKNRTGVLISWKKPQLKDIASSILTYALTCNMTGSNNTRYFSLARSSMFLQIPQTYFPTQCRLRVMKGLGITRLPFIFNPPPAVVNFRSLSLRPSVTPHVTVIKFLSEAVKIFVQCTFTKFEYGVVKGIVVNATMISYGGRKPTQRFVKDIVNKVIPLSKGTTFLNQSFGKIGKLKPWSKYNIKVAVYNEDNLLSNPSKGVTASTREGKPTQGPSLVIMMQAETSLSLKVKQEKGNLDIVHNNGKLTSYTLLYREENSNKNKTMDEPYKADTIFEITGLKPSTRYIFRCKAATKAGKGPFGKALKLEMNSGIPSEPIDLQPISTSYQFGIEWQQPHQPGGRITKYEIRVTYNNHTVLHFNHYKTAELQRLFDFRTLSVEQVAIRAYTKAGAGEWSPPLIINLTNNPLNKQTALIIGFSVAFALFAAFVVMCFVYFRRQYRAQPPMKDYQLNMLNSQEIEVFHDDEDPNESDMEIGSFNDSGSSQASSTYNVGRSAHNPVPVEEFSGYINMAKQDDYKIFLSDFRNQLPVGRCYSCSIADKPENIEKNRYSNICAYDHSRIVLKNDVDDEGISDYINANSLYGYTKHEDGNYKYISTQGPLESTVADFWHMVWQEGSNIIVMLTNLEENEKVKCVLYWPHEDTKTYGRISVTLDKIERTADYIMRTFQIAHLDSKEQRIVRQFHFVPWPDHGVPDYPTALLSLRRRVRHYYETGKPMVVHCSAGVGRSGCFILIDAMLERIDNEHTVDIFSYLNYMRTRRIYMVQTFEQYIFAHTAVLEYITFGNTETFLGELDKKFKDLVRGNGMAEEFALLEMNKVSDRQPDNVSKVVLRDGTLVEASLVDGFKQRNAFILTKAPSENNVIDFWKMVLEKQCHTIVMLNKCQEDSQEYFKYWPDLDGHNSYQNIAVMLNSEVANGNIMTRKVKVTTNNRRCEVNHFQFVDWPDTDIPDQRVYNNICTLMQAVEKSQHNLGNGPIIVHSGNDYGRSGTFIAVYNSTERLKVEQLIDVLQCVRAIRITQPLAVDNVCQYQFIYNMLRTYLEGFENYCNYKEYNVCRSPFGSTSSTFS